MTDRYAVIGNPVAHSRSPDIHAHFALDTRQDLSYARLLAPLDGFESVVARFRADGGRGMNVTVPFKVEAFDFVRGAGSLGPRAVQAGAVNTLCFEGETVHGDNTDGVGLCRDLSANLEFPLAGARILILGAGGAARGVIAPLLSFEPALIAIANRTAARANELAARFASPAASIRALALEELAAHRFDLVINATSASLADALPPVPSSVFAPAALAYDMVYGKGGTPFLTLAAHAGARTADGLGMLVEQAAESFALWRGVRPDTRPVIAALRESMAS